MDPTESIEWLKSQAANVVNIDKRYLLAMGILLWLHGVTMGIVFEGQKGLLNRFLWTFVVALLPMFALVKSKTWRKVAASWLYFELATLIMCFFNSLAWYRNPKNLMPLPDIGHDLLPELKKKPDAASWIHKAEEIPDAVMGILVASTLLFTISRPRKWTILQRFFIVYGTLCIMRSVTVISTSLPDSAEKCRRMTPTGNLSSGANRWEDITLRQVVVRSFKLLIPVGEVTCGDMVFSGHSMLMVLCAMTWHTYYKRVPGSVNYVKVSIWILTLFGLISIIWVRMHYSIDVVLALYFSVTVWSTYHRMANDVKIGHRFSAVWIVDALLIYPAIEWLETPEGDEEAEAMQDEDAEADYSPPRPVKYHTPYRLPSPVRLRSPPTSPHPTILQRRRKFQEQAATPKPSSSSTTSRYSTRSSTRSRSGKLLPGLE